MSTRTEHDSLGLKEVPADAYYGVQTQRAIENFPISGVKPHPEFVKATILVKKAAAQANMKLGYLKPNIGKAIIQAADEVLQGKLRNQFVVDVFQAGAGTSHNMNTNEVLANRAIEILGGRKGDYSLVHPNDHVNMAQSTNDVFPTAMRVACLSMMQMLLPEIQNLAKALLQKAKEFDHIVKSGRTHLQDAAPIRLGQEFAAYAQLIEDAIARIDRASHSLEPLNLGATAVGTGLNADPRYMKLAVENLRKLTGLPFRQPENLAAITQSMTDFVEFSGALRALAVDLTKISNDLRLMSSGPVTGIGEITLPPVQPGSSIMPGKVNPVIAEATNMVAFYIMGLDLTVALAAQAGQFELNVMMPVIAYCLMQDLEILRNITRVLTEKLVKGIRANEERCRSLLERSAGIALALNPYIGYDAAAKVAKEALAAGKPLREIVLEKKLLPKENLEKILDPHTMTEPGIAGKKKK